MRLALVLRIVPKKRFVGVSHYRFANCECGCMAPQGGRSAATFVAVFLDRYDKAIFLCGKCAKEWEATFGEVGPTPMEEAA